MLQEILRKFDLMAQWYLLEARLLQLRLQSSQLWNLSRLMSPFQHKKSI
jgi:hypothetical protein